jgi:hypothetical protein
MATLNHRPEAHMPEKTFQVQLSLVERARLQALVSNGCSTAHAHIHARILLKADQGPDGPAWTDAMISSALDIGLSTVARVRQTAVQEGLEAAVQRKLPKRVSIVGRECPGSVGNAAQIDCRQCCPAPIPHAPRA